MTKTGGMFGKCRKTNLLLEKIVEIVSAGRKGKVLDLGCGDGKTGKEIFDRGFIVEACDMDAARFLFHNVIPFNNGNLNDKLPYRDGMFDYVIFMEVIEHVYNPDFVMAEISRVLRKGGVLVLSTPNILNIGSRLRFLFEGSYDFFREPVLDYARCFPAALQNMHVIPWRYHELEYLLEKNGLKVDNLYVDRQKANLIFPALVLKPVMWVQSLVKNGRTRQKGGVDYSRINKILFSSEMLLGKHLILKSTKQ